MRFFESKPTFAFSVVLSIAIFAGQHAGAEELNTLPLKISPANTASVAQSVTNFRCHISPVRHADGTSRPVARPYCDQPAALTTAPATAAPTDLKAALLQYGAAKFELGNYEVARFLRLDAAPDRV